jgi:hypothetical protein
MSGIRPQNLKKYFNNVIMGHPLEKQEIGVLILISAGNFPPTTPPPPPGAALWLVRRGAVRQFRVRILPGTPPLIYAENPKRFKL